METDKVINVKHDVEERGSVESFENTCYTNELFVHCFTGKEAGTTEHRRTRAERAASVPFSPD